MEEGRREKGGMMKLQEIGARAGVLEGEEEGEACRKLPS